MRYFILSAGLAITGCSSQGDTGLGTDHAQNRRLDADEACEAFMATYGHSASSLRATAAVCQIAVENADLSNDHLRNEVRESYRAAFRTSISEVPVQSLGEVHKAFDSPVILSVPGTITALAVGSWTINGSKYLQLLEGAMLLPRLFPFTRVAAPTSNASAFLIKRTTPTAYGSNRRKANLLSRHWHNFGIVDNKAKLRTEAELRNCFARAVTVRVPRVSCSCVNARIEGHMTLAPNDTAKLIVDVNPTLGRAVRQQVEIDVVDDDGRTFTEEFYLFAISPEVARMHPEQIDFGAVEWDAPAQRRYVVIAEAIDDPLGNFASLSAHGNDTTPLSDCISASLVRQLIKNGRRQNYIEITLDVSNAPFGQHDDVCNIHTDSVRTPTLSIPVRYERLSPLRLPPVVSFGAVAIGERIVKRIPVRIRASEQVSLVARGAPDACTIQWEAQKGDNGTVCLSCIFTGGPGPETIRTEFAWRYGELIGNGMLLLKADVTPTH